MVLLVRAATAAAVRQTALTLQHARTVAPQDGAAERAADERVHGACDHAAALAHDLPLSRRGGCRAPCRWCPSLLGLIIISTLTGIIGTLTGIISTLISAEAEALRAADVTVSAAPIYPMVAMPKPALSIEYVIC